MIGARGASALNTYNLLNAVAAGEIADNGTRNRENHCAGSRRFRGKLSPIAFSCRRVNNERSVLLFVGCRVLCSAFKLAIIATLAVALASVLPAYAQWEDDIVVFSICESGELSTADAEAAANVWRPSNLNIEITAVDCGALSDSANRVAVTDLPNVNPEATQPQFVSFAHVATQDDGCDIDLGSTWFSGSADPDYDLVTALAHEMGHCLGLDDLPFPVTGPNPVMATALRPGEQRRALTDLDLASLRLIYGGAALH